jgi:hypothetical protein
VESRKRCFQGRVTHRSAPERYAGKKSTSMKRFIGFGGEERCAPRCRHGRACPGYSTGVNDVEMARARSSTMDPSPPSSERL